MTDHIRFSTDILTRLGEELNPSPDQGILELVKNTYDANATTCRIELRGVDQSNGSVVVTDDGDGMDAEVIRSGWLVVGRSAKEGVTRTRLGRVPAGSKGLGRLAALRLGRVASLTTWPRSEPGHQYTLRIDWDLFDNASLVEDVPLTIQRTERPDGRSNGTEISLEKLRPRMSKLDAKKLARALVLLADPFGDDRSGFKPILSAPEFSDLETLVKNRYFQDADFHLVAHVRDGIATASVVDWRGATLFQADHAEISKKRGGVPYPCPNSSFDLWAFVLSKDTFQTRNTTLGEVRAWLAQFGGVHVYYNGLRVQPYGNPGNDWLELNLSRARSPEHRPSTNNSIGRIVLDDSSNQIKQKTDRSGFIEDPLLDALIEFAQDSLDWMARQRLAEAEKARAADKTTVTSATTKVKQALDKAVESVPTKNRDELKQAISSFERTHERQVTALRREVQLFRTLSTVGITASIFAHESAGNPIKAITASIKTIERRAIERLKSEYQDLLKRPVDGIIRAVASLSVLGTATLRLLQHEKRRPVRLELHKVIERTIDTLIPFVSGRGIDVVQAFCQGDPYMRATEADIESILTNLLNNSIVALELSERKPRQIRVSTRIDSGPTIVLSVSDSGSGIEGISVRDIWLPGETTRSSGTGLGLTIVRDTVRDLGGSVIAVEHGELGGAEFHITLPILGH